MGGGKAFWRGPRSLVVKNVSCCFNLFLFVVEKLSQLTGACRNRCHLFSSILRGKLRLDFLQIQVSTVDSSNLKS